MKELHLFPLVFGAVNGHLEQAAVQLHSDRSVIVTRNGVRHQAGVAVGVHHADRGDVHLGCVSDSDVLLEDIVESGQEDDEVRQTGILA